MLGYTYFYDVLFVFDYDDDDNYYYSKHGILLWENKNT